MQASTYQQNKKLPEIRRGDTKTWELNFADASDNPLDITGHIITVTMKELITDPNSRAIISLSATAGDAVNDDPINGKMFFTLPASETAKLSIQTYHIGMSRRVTAVPEDIITTFLVTEVDVIPDVTIN